MYRARDFTKLKQILGLREPETCAHHVEETDLKTPEKVKVHT